MIIRSQDKKKIFNLEQIRKIDCETNSVMADDVSVMGTYSTEEKAIKVLDMIQKAYSRMEDIRCGAVQAQKNDLFCFDMPSDEKVEV